MHGAEASAYQGGKNKRKKDKTIHSLALIVSLIDR